MVLIWLLLLGWWSSLSTAPTGGQTYAVVVGISDYQALSYSTGDLRYADQDAQQVVRFLESKAGGHVAPDHIRLLTNQQATWTNIQRSLTLFGRDGVNDRVILYFSGHGTADRFVPYDVVPGRGQKLLTYPAIKAAFHESRAATKLCIADACLSGSMTQPTKSRKLTQPIAGNVSAGSSVAMLLASRSTEYALETSRLRGGAFTHFLLKGLSGQADRNQDKVVTIRELHRYVGPQVRQITRNRQAPVFYGRFPDDLVLANL